MADDVPGFGSCCDELQEVMDSDEFEPLVFVGEDGKLYMCVGYAEVGNGQIGWFDHAVIHCPFCGTQLQSREGLGEGQRPS